MARWRLIEPHYINVVDRDGKNAVTWEYLETDRANGRQKRRTFPVPQHFHPDIEADWTERNGIDMGWVVVSDGHNAGPKDIIFVGEPTPGMLALDDEARAISAKYSHKCNQPDRLPSVEEASYAGKMMDAYVESQGKVNMLLAEATQKEIPGMSDFMQVMANMMKQNQQILMSLAEKAIAKELDIKPEVDDLEPLPEYIEPEKHSRSRYYASSSRRS